MNYIHYIYFRLYRVVASFGDKPEYGKKDVLWLILLFIMFYSGMGSIFYETCTSIEVSKETRLVFILTLTFNYFYLMWSIRITDLEIIINKFKNKKVSLSYHLVFWIFVSPPFIVFIYSFINHKN